MDQKALEVSPLLAHDTPRTVDQAESLHRQAALGNLFIKIPGTAEGLPAIEECIYAGVPVNVTLLFSAAQYEAAAGAYLRGVERRIRSGLDPAVGSVASLFVSRWDTAVAGRVPGELRDRLGIAVAKQAYRGLLVSPRWARLANEGARAQRLPGSAPGTSSLSAPPDRVATVEHTLITEPDAGSLAARAAGYVADRIRAVAGVADQHGFTFAVSGGQTPWRMLTELAQHDLPWSSVTIYQVDERIAPDGDPARNLTHLRRILGSRPVTLHAMPVTEWAELRGRTSYSPDKFTEAVYQVVVAGADPGDPTTRRPWSAVIRAGSRRGCQPTAEPVRPRGS